MSSMSPELIDQTFDTEFSQPTVHTGQFAAVQETPAEEPDANKVPRLDMEAINASLERVKLMRSALDSSLESDAVWIEQQEQTEAKADKMLEAAETYEQARVAQMERVAAIRSQLEGMTMLVQTATNNQVTVRGRLLDLEAKQIELAQRRVSLQQMYDHPLRLEDERFTPQLCPCQVCADTAQNDPETERLTPQEHEARLQTELYRLVSERQASVENITLTRHKLVVAEFMANTKQDGADVEEAQRAAQAAQEMLDVKNTEYTSARERLNNIQTAVQKERERLFQTAVTARQGLPQAIRDAQAALDVNTAAINNIYPELTKCRDASELLEAEQARYIADLDEADRELKRLAQEYTLGYEPGKAQGAVGGKGQAGRPASNVASPTSTALPAETGQQPSIRGFVGTKRIKKGY